MLNKLELPLPGERYVLVFTRVSSGGQKERVQLDLAKAYCQGIPPERIVFISEHGVSANKVPLYSRKGMMDLISMIKHGLVDSIVVYDRSRLARNYYEAMELYPLFKAHRVKVFFTAANSQPFGDYLQEAILAIFAEMDGKNIARRHFESHMMWPAQLIGFVRVKRTEGSDKLTEYRHDKDNAPLIKELFDEFRVAESHEEFFRILVKYTNLLRRTPDRILGILETPFFAGVKPQGEGFFKLEHVNPIISVDTFKSVQEQLGKYKSLIEHVQSPEGALVRPSCRICGREMNYKRRDISTLGEYTCSRKHKKNAISVEELNSVIVEVMRQKFALLDLKKLRHECLVAAQKQHQKYSQFEQVYKSSLDKASITLALSGPTSERLEMVKDLKIKITNASVTKARLLCLMQDVDDFVSDVVNYLKGVATDRFIRTLAEHAISSCMVDSDTISVTLYFGEYMNPEEVESCLVR